MSSRTCLCQTVTNEETGEKQASVLVEDDEVPRMLLECAVPELHRDVTRFS